MRHLREFRPPAPRPPAAALFAGFRQNRSHCSPSYPHCRTYHPCVALLQREQGALASACTGTGRRPRRPILCSTHPALKNTHHPPRPGPSADRASCGCSGSPSASTSFRASGRRSGSTRGSTRAIAPALVGVDAGPPVRQQMPSHPRPKEQSNVAVVGVHDRREGGSHGCRVVGWSAAVELGVADAGRDADASRRGRPSRRGRWRPGPCPR